MRTISPEFSDHLSGEVTSYCRCWKIIRTDGAVLGFTEHDRVIVIIGTNYQPATGLDASAAESSLGLNSDSAEVIGALASAEISEQDIFAHKYDSARVEVIVVNWNNPAEYFLEQVYFIGEISREDGIFKAELRTLASQLDQTKGLHFIKQCQADLGDGKCKVNLNATTNRGFGTVTVIGGAKEFSASGLTQYKSQWFTHGYLKWTSGQNTGVSIEVSDHLNNGTGASLQIWREMSQPIAIGDLFEVSVGCDKQFETCKAKFSNPLNFRGFPHLPGSEFALNYVSKSDELDGGVIVP